MAEGNNDDKLEVLPPTFCIHPFLEVNVIPAGSARPCCAYLPVLSKDGRPMSVYESTLEEIWNSDAMRSLRRNLVEGKRDPGCGYCYSQEDAGVPSLRMINSQAWRSGYINPRNESFSDLMELARSNDYGLPDGPNWIDLDMGNLCNLKCRMCMPASSSSIANDPVQSRWTPDYEIPARWQGSAMVIAPARVLGVSYEGLSQLDQSGATSVAWISGVATIRLKSAPREASSIQIKLRGDVTLQSPIEIFVNDVSSYRGELSHASSGQTVELPLDALNAEDLAIRIECPSRIGVEELKLLRTERGKNVVGMSRFSSGKQWFQDQDFLFNDVLYKVENVTKINMIGGEPMLIKEVLSTLKHLVDKDLAKNITLTAVTNGTVISEELCRLLPNFNYVILGVSLDGVGEVNDYIRANSNWAEIDQNIKRLKRVHKTYLYTNITVQACNMLHVVPLARYCLENEVNFRYHYLQAPVHLSCGVMPVAARKEAVARMREFLARCSPEEDARLVRLYIKQSLLTLCETLDADEAEPNPKLVEDFMTFTNDLDISRGQLFSSVNSELLDFIEASGVKWSNQTRFAQLGRGPSGCKVKLEAEVGLNDTDALGSLVTSYAANEEIADCNQAGVNCCLETNILNSVSADDSSQGVTVAGRKKLYVHIGVFKTGTTSIQHFLDKNIGGLADQGVLYPKTGRHPHSPAQHGVIGEMFLPEPLSAAHFTLPGSIDRQSLLKALLDEIEASPASRIILSSEALCTLAPEQVGEFGQQFKNFDIVPIVYLRNFPDLADASYQTHVIWNMTTKIISETGVKHWVDWDLVAMCQSWSAIAHDGRILVQDYDDPAELDSILSFARMTELEMEKLVRADDDPNKSVSPTLVMIKSELVRGGVRPYEADRLLAELQSLPFSERQTMLPPALGRDLRQAYTKQLGLLAASEFVVGLDATRLERETEEPPEKIQILNLVDALFSIGRAVARMKEAEKIFDRELGRAQEYQRKISDTAVLSHSAG